MWAGNSTTLSVKQLIMSASLIIVLRHAYMKEREDSSALGPDISTLSALQVDYDFVHDFSCNVAALEVT